MDNTLSEVLQICLEETSKNPIEILRTLMARPFCPMHGPVHHYLVGAALLTAYKNAGGEIELETAILEYAKRAEAVPGGACGNWGACGAGIGTGMFVSIITGAGPLTVEPWKTTILMTTKALQAIGEIGGPRCCKRDSYLAIISAVEYVKENIGISMEYEDIKCIHSNINSQCIQTRCPFYQDV